MKQVMLTLKWSAMSRGDIFVGLELMFDCVFWHVSGGFFYHLFERETVEK